MNHPPTTLAATIDDAEGVLVPAIQRLAVPLRSIFSGIALNISDATHESVISAVREVLGAKVMIHAHGLAIVGRARRDSLRLGLEYPHPQLLYSDFDHALRWVEGDPDELRHVLAAQPEADFLVVGRSARSFAAEPSRLQETERIVNHIYALMTGRDWDLMSAIRRLSRPAAQAIVANARSDTIASDVEWPLLAEQSGIALGYAQTDAFSYRTMDEFGAPADTGDGDPRKWIERIEYAANHVAAMRPFLTKPR